MATIGRWEQMRERALELPEHRARYERNKGALVQSRQILMQIDAVRESLGISKAELARRIGADKSVIRRLFSSADSNPRLQTVLSLLGALRMGLEVRPSPVSQPRSTATRRDS